MKAAEAELIANSHRSDRLIAALVQANHRTVSRDRKRLEAAAIIKPASVRTPRAPNGLRKLGRAQRALAERRA